MSVHPLHPVNKNDPRRGLYFTVECSLRALCTADIHHKSGLDVDIHAAESAQFGKMQHRQQGVFDSCNTVCKTGKQDTQVELL